MRMVSSTGILGAILTLTLVMLLILGACAQPAPSPSPSPAPKATPAPAVTPATTPKPAPSTPAPGAVKWKLQSSFPPTSYAGAEFFLAFANIVKQKTGGKLEIEVMAPDAMVAAGETFTASTKGVVQGGCSVGSYHARVLPEGEIEQGLPGNFNTLEQSYEFHYQYKNGSYLKLLDEAYREKGAHLLALGSYTNSLQTKFPINKITDLKGKNIRATGANTKLMNALGANGVNIAAAEQYTALQRGTADGTIMATYATKTYKLMEVTDYISLPPLSIGILDMYVNLEAFNKLSPDIQKIMEEAAVAAANNLRAKYVGLEAADIELAKSKGVKVITLSDDEFAKIRAAAAPVWNDTAAPSPRCAALVDLLRSYLKEKGIR